MRRCALFLFLAVIPLSRAQAPPDAPEPAATPAVSIELWARPLHPIDSAWAKPGQVVALELWHEVRNLDGSVLLPKGARLFGVLTLVESRIQEGGARLALYVMRAEWKGGSATLNAFLAGPVRRPREKPEARLLALDRTTVRFVRGPFTEPSPEHAHIRIEGDPTYGVVYASRAQDIRLSGDVVLPLRHIQVNVLRQAARR